MFAVWGVIFMFVSELFVFLIEVHCPRLTPDDFTIRYVSDFNKIAKFSGIYNAQTFSDLELFMN